jgi:two-component system, sensor histidine kinase and response regulator
MKEAYLAGHYHGNLVALSVAIAICASYAALSLGNRTASSRGRARAAWLAGGAIAMGIGIWAMHYIGMLAFYLPVPIRYHVPTVALSLLAAILASAVALFVVSRPKIGLLSIAAGSLSMGAAISAMHYIGMAAVRLSASLHYDFWIVTASVLIAIVVSGVALWIAFRFRESSSLFGFSRLASAVAMGFAVASMHYTGMSAVCFQHLHTTVSMQDSVDVSALGIAGITSVTFLVLIIALSGAFFDRYVSLQKSILSKTQLEYRLVMDRNLAGVCRTSWEGRVLEANQAAAEFLGYAHRDQMLGINIALHYTAGEDRADILDQLLAKGAVNGLKLQLKRLDGTPVWGLYNKTLLRDENGAPEIITTVMDISGLKNTQEELIAARRQAEDANLAKSQFLANMSHELRTPLNGVIGMTGLALECELPPDAREFLQIASMSAQALITIVNDVLDFSKLEARKLVLDFHEFSLREVIDNACKTVLSAASEKGLKLIVKPHSDPGLFIGDAGRIRQVLLNLLANAIKFTNEGQVSVAIVSVTSRVNDAVVQISVSDTGIGIPADKLGIIFEAFAQADPSNTRRFGGTGLGLAICSQLLRAMRGEIWVESVVGSGSTFHFTVTLDLPHSAAQSGSGPSSIAEVALS